jgi:hypothetical protein
MFMKHPTPISRTRPLRAHFLWVLFYLLILCVACSANGSISVGDQTGAHLMNAPLSPVGFIDEVIPYPGATIPSASEICVVIGPGSIFESSDEPEPLARHIISHFRLVVDRETISPDMMKYESILTNYDGSVGSAGGYITACAKVKLTNGLHVVTTETKSTSGKVFAYSWAFKINPNIPGDQATKAQFALDPYAIRRATSIARLGNPPPNPSETQLTPAR